MKLFPKVGVGVMIFKNGKVLLTQRKGSHGAGEYAFPGGHLEFGESIKECAIRETKEEAGIKIKDIKFLFCANVTKYEGKHYAHIGLIAKWKNGEPQLLEPEKSSGWKWYPLNKLPRPMFEMCKLSFKAYKKKILFFDSK